MNPGDSAPGASERPPAAMAAAPAAPARESAPPPRLPEAPAASTGTGTDSKYVVWSSTPSDAPRTGPDDQ
jgi:hypothetical protein